MSSAFPPPNDNSSHSVPETITKDPEENEESAFQNNVSPLQSMRETMENIRRGNGRRVVSFDAVQRHTEEQPIAEVVGQEAIEELINNIFNQIDETKEVDFPKFEKIIYNDMSLLAWFEALGTVF